MKLVVDQGNTKLKIALFKGNQMLDLKTFENTTEVDANNLIDELESTFQANGSIESGIYASVGPVNERFINQLKQRIKLIILDSELPLPVSIKYATPASLGRDRIALAVGACNEFPDMDVLVIDAGTCITFDFINKHKDYLGGSIAPGINMRFKALHTFTSNLPLITQLNTPDLIGDSTITSIQSGVMNGVKAEVMGIIEQYKTRYPSLIVVFTGGDLNYFDKNTKSNIFAVPNLVLLGLKEILEYNAKK